MLTLQAILVVLLVGTHAATVTNHASKPSRRLDVVNPSLVIRSVASFQECLETCQRWTNCVVANFRRRGHVCSLLQRTREKEAVFEETKKAGVWSWKKPGIKETDVACTSCDRKKACAIVDGTCKVSACKDPEMFGKNRTNGNLRTVGSKASFRCFNHTTGRMYMHVIECSPDGTWTNTENICGYSKHVIEGETVLLKLVEVEVNQTTALSNCGHEGASLATVLTTGKMKYLDAFLRTYVSMFTVTQLWIDMQKQDGYWATSDGRMQSPEAATFWRITAFFSCLDCNCAILQAGIDWLLEPKECERMNKYLCEIVIT